MTRFDRLRTLAWYHTVADEAGAATPYEVGNVIDQLRVETSDALHSVAKSFFPYAKGAVKPSDETLDLVEGVLPWTKNVFTIGPKIEGGFAPLWLALGGTEEGVRSVLVWFRSDLGQLQAQGSSVFQLIHVVTDRWFPSKFVFDAMGDTDLPNLVEGAYREGLLEVSFELLTVLVALWQLSILRLEDFPYINYLVEGLLEKAMPDLMRPYGIGDEFVEYLRHIANLHWSYLKRLQDGRLGDGEDRIVSF